MTETRIRWTAEAPKDAGVIYIPAWTGYVGTVKDPAFKIYRPDDEHDNWLLSVRLTANGERRFIRADDPATLKADAEFMLSEFVSSLGAVFPRPAQLPERPGRRRLTDVDVLDAFRTVTNWSDAEVLHYESCGDCDPFASVVCEAFPAPSGTVPGAPDDLR